MAADEATAQVDAAVAPLSILVVAHPYITRDSYLSGAVLEALESMDVTVLYAEAVDHDKAYKESFDFSDTLPWIVNRELIGAITAAAPPAWTASCWSARSPAAPTP